MKRSIKKKLICLVLALVMTVSALPLSVFAADTTKYIRPLTFEENIATNLKTLNLFKGVSDTDFALDRIPSRIEALVIMLRLMGKETEILSGSYSHPFTDVPDWANQYVGFAYQNKLTNGVDATLFGTDNATDAQFLTFILRAMGYSDAKGDFTWDNPYQLATELGVINEAVVTGEGFLRADCASISYYALGAKVKGGAQTLADKLIEDQVFERSAYESVKASMPDYPGIFKAYGLQFHTNPKTIDDQYDNMCYYIASGAFEWTYDGTGNLGINVLACIRPEIAGYVMNQARQFCQRNGKYYIKLKSPAQSPYTPQEVSAQIIAAYDAAKKIDLEIRASGAIKSSSSEKVKATAVSNYLQSYGVQTPQGFAEGSVPSDYTDVGSRIKYMSYDTAYGALVNKCATCGGRAAAYNLIMSLEGIKSIGLEVTAHMVSYLFLEGEEYLCDWGNGYGLFTVADVTDSASYFDNGRLEVVREYYVNGASKLNEVRLSAAQVSLGADNMPELTLQKTRSDSTYDYYKVTMADQSYEGTSLKIVFGDNNYYYIYEALPVSRLKRGVEIQVSKNDIADYDMLEYAYFVPVDWKQ